MAQKIRIRHTESGITRNGYVGFSFTYLFFGWLVPLIRGEIKIGALHLVFNIFTFCLWQLIACFIYNRQYMTRMLTNGWELNDSDANNNHAKMKLNITEHSNE